MICVSGSPVGLGVCGWRSACPACGTLSSRLGTAPSHTGPRLWPRVHLRAGEVYRSSQGRLQYAGHSPGRLRMERGWRRCSRVWVTFLGMPYGRTGGRADGRAPVDTCQGTVNVTVPGKQAARPAAPSRSQPGGGARSVRACAGGPGLGRGACRCAKLAGRERGAGTVGTRPRGQDRGRGRWPPLCYRGAGQTGTRLPLAARAAAAA